MKRFTNIGIVWLVYRKETLETLRDKRTLFVMILLPLALYPLLAFLGAQWMQIHHKERDAEMSRVGIIDHGQRWLYLEEELDSDPKIKIVPIKSLAQIKDGKVDLAIDLPADCLHALTSGQTATIDLIFDETKFRSKYAKKRVRGVIEEIEKKQMQFRIEQRRLSSQFIDPLVWNEQSIVNVKERSAHELSVILPILILLVVALGAFYPAIDLTAGEKERGTLETLLTVPVPRFALIMGKFLTVSTIATITGFLNLGSMGLTLIVGFQPVLEKIQHVFVVPWTSVVMTSIAIVPTSLFFASVMMAVASVARSFKEAQNLLTPVYLICLVPAMFAQMPGVELTLFTSLVPAINVSLLTRAFISGNVPILPSITACLSTVLYSAVALGIAARIYNSERLLFASAPSGKKKTKRDRSQPKQKAAPKTDKVEPLQAGLLFLGITALLLLVGQPIQAWNVIKGIMITEWILIALPVFLLLHFARIAPKPVLSLNMPRPMVLVGVALAGCTAWYLVAFFVQTVQEKFLPMPPEFAETMQKLLISGDRSILIDLFALAISPAICEELLFRGVLLRSTRNSLKPTTAVVFNAVLFGLFHMSIWRFFPTAFLGAILTTIVLRTRSIYPAMLFHMINNGIAIVIGRILTDVSPHGSTKLEEQMQLEPVLLIAMTVVFIGGMYLVLKKPQEGKKED